MTARHLPPPEEPTPGPTPGFVQWGDRDPRGYLEEMGRQLLAVQRLSQAYGTKEFREHAHELHFATALFTAKALVVWMRATLPTP